MDRATTRAAVRREVAIPAAGLTLGGTLAIPEDARGIVLFAHGSGSSRHSPRNRLVAEALHDAGMGTLLFDLLARDEDAGYEKRFDIVLLSRRLLAATDWIANQPDAAGLTPGYFGASTGAAAALVASARRRDVRAVVSRGGRPDLAGHAALGAVTAPTLLIVGGDDGPVIALNRAAAAKMHCERSVVIVPGATHLFEEPGALEHVARLAAEWFGRWLPSGDTR